MNIIKRLWVVQRLKRQFYKWDLPDLRKHQEDRVNKILTYARENSPYFQRVLPPDYSFGSVPVMNKASMMEHFDEINTVGLKRDELVQFKIQQEREGKLDLFQEKYSVGLSSGTSGNRGLTTLAKTERELYGCLLWARSGIPQHVKKFKILFALRTNNPAFMEPRSFGAKIVYVDYTHPPEELANLINVKGLNILAGPPSLLKLIGQHRKHIFHPIDVLISYAEVLDEETRNYLKDTFDAPVAQIYQGAEGFIGSTCKKGNLHFNEDTILVEQADLDDNSAKKIIITDLYRTTQPIIRYSLEDVVEIAPDRCECGSCFRVIKLIHGRADDIFILEGIQGENRHLFPDYIRRSINQASDAILEYQAIQHKIDAIEIRLVLKSGADRKMIEKTICENLAWRAGKVGGKLGKLTFNEIPPERNPRSQKLIRVIRRL